MSKVTLDYPTAKALLTKDESFKSFGELWGGGGSGDSDRTPLYIKLDIHITK